MKKFLTQRNIYICLFAMLYVATALVSTIHAVSFFCLANVMALGILLAVTFEIGQAATLFSILTSKKDRSKAMPWILMFILTGVQILGNVFSSYRYLISNSADQLRFFKEPIFVWMDLPNEQANVILTYIIGAVLPIVALALTGMLTNYLEDNKPDDEHLPEPEIIEKEIIKEVDNPNQAAEIERLKAELEAEKNKPTPAPQIIEKEIIKEVPIKESTTKPVETPTVKPTENPTIEQTQADELINNATKSHFINLK